MTMKASHDFNIPNRHIFRTLVKKSEWIRIRKSFFLILFTLLVGIDWEVPVPPCHLLNLMHPLCDIFGSTIQFMLRFNKFKKGLCYSYFFPVLWVISKAFTLLREFATWETQSKVYPFTLVSSALVQLSFHRVALLNFFSPKISTNSA